MEGVQISTILGILRVMLCHLSGRLHQSVFLSLSFGIRSDQYHVLDLVLTYVSISATRIGISNDFSFYFVAIVNAASLFGRYAAGYICDSVGQSMYLSL